MKKFTIAIICAFIVSASTPTVQASCTASGIGALFILQDAVCDNDESEDIKVIDGDKSDIKFSFKLAEIIRSLFD